MGTTSGGRRRRTATRVLTAALLVTHPHALTLESGQRISPLLPTVSPASTLDSPPRQLHLASKATTTGLLELPAVEQWATEENLGERHLKTLYRVLLRSPAPSWGSDSDSDSGPDANGGGDGSSESSGDNNLFQRLVDNDFPRSAATSLLIHNDHYRFVPCTSRVISVSPSSRGCKLAVQYDGEGGPVVETVLIRHDAAPSSGEDRSPTPTAAARPRYTVCVSCQDGCSKACTFCETGTMGLRGSLTSGQILEQVWHVEQYLLRQEQQQQQQQQRTDDGTGGDRGIGRKGRARGGGKVRNIVFMGEGEAFDTYPSVHEACRGLTHQCLFGLAAKQITISTVGASPGKIRDLANDMPQVSLALSLHGATQELREELIPSARGARGSTLDELASALDYHAERTGRGVMIEYLLIKGVNDADEAADALGRFCLDRRDNHKNRTGRHSSVTYVNLIPYNPTAAGERFGYETPSDDSIERFSGRLRERFGLRALVRWSSAAGRDANGACGQLAIKER